MSTTPTFEPVELPSRYAKAYVMILTTAVAAVSAALAGGLSLDEVVSIAVLVLSTIGVYLVPLGSAGVQRYSKLLIAVLGTAGQAAVPLLMNGGTVDTSGWLLIFLAALGAVSVGITPNAPAQAEFVALRRVLAAKSRETFATGGPVDPDRGV